MREIKFRCWQSETKQMVDLKKITPLALSAGLEQDGIFIPFNDSWPVMQFTGLLDKDGKEIYEGDILQVAYNLIYEVLFITEDETCETVSAFGIKSGDRKFPIDAYAVETGEVVGNIYENPELIDKLGE